MIWLLLSRACNAVEPKTSRLFPAILIFGDSTIDPGNNNYIPTLFKANYNPYGRDFPGHIATGRFSNGKLIPDILASTLGIKELVPAFLDPMLSDGDLRTGVSFGSAGSGYDDLTTSRSRVIPMLKQIDLFKNYIQRLERIVGEEKAKRILKGALVIVSAGSNDFILNFYDIPSRSLEFNISGYQAFVQNRLQSLIKGLYQLGCRTIFVVGLPPIGCLPIQETVAFQDPKNRKCLENQNSDSQIYNHKLTTLLHGLQSLLPGSKIHHVDIYNPLIDMINHPKRYGFVQTTKGCCGTGLAETGPLCNPETPTCEDPKKYLFWDSVHPTESAYYFIADSILKQLGFKQIRN
ncbi:GDSL esterase/lipase At1g06990-like [Cucurbita maxima]|uniref:GDSL esterase/lipase At1g06990-like n=1 Tax=Cucurbita maxima TaxID=3661 RepID=A0A6J1J8U7_CUCMA|nr:GDSL esterase/lipase At1g06990-like [Cucurbita maxima]